MLRSPQLRLSQRRMFGSLASFSASVPEAASTKQPEKEEEKNERETEDDEEDDALAAAGILESTDATDLEVACSAAAAASSAVAGSQPFPRELVSLALEAAHTLSATKSYQAGGTKAYRAALDELLARLQVLPEQAARTQALQLMADMDANFVVSSISSWRPYALEILGTLGEDATKISEAQRGHRKRAS